MVHLCLKEQYVGFVPSGRYVVSIRRWFEKIIIYLPTASALLTQVEEVSVEGQTLKRFSIHSLEWDRKFFKDSGGL